MSRIERDDLGRLYDILVRDIGQIVGRSSSLPQYKRRSFVRAFLALVEYDTYNRKQRVLYLHTKGVHRFNESERIMLQEIQPELDDSGRLKLKRRYLRLIDNYRFAIRMFCKAVDIEFTLPTNEPGWSAFKETVALRNRITHPKKLSEIEISDSQLKSVFDAFEWFKKVYRAIVDATNRRHREDTT
jgi:hypothetical protein